MGDREGWDICQIVRLNVSLILKEKKPCRRKDLLDVKQQSRLQREGALKSKENGV